MVAETVPTWTVAHDLDRIRAHRVNSIDELYAISGEPSDAIMQ
jgi:hypothetical protein